MIITKAQICGVFLAVSRCTHFVIMLDFSKRKKMNCGLFFFCLYCCFVFLGRLSADDKRFELVTILPGLVIGPNALQNAISTNIVSELRRIILLK